MFHAGIVAHGLDVIDDVVGVLLERVIDARLEIGLGAVIIDAETAAYVEVVQSRARLDELDIDTRRLVQRPLDDADVRDLAAKVEMEELEAILHAQ
jgi:hypothetical protein